MGNTLCVTNTMLKVVTYKSLDHIPLYPRTYVNRVRKTLKNQHIQLAVTIICLLEAIELLDTENILGTKFSWIIGICKCFSTIFHPYSTTIVENVCRKFLWLPIFTQQLNLQSHKIFLSPCNHESLPQTFIR